MANKPLPSIAYLRQRLSYDADTGELRWRDCPAAGERWNSRWAGRIAGSVKPDGYTAVCVNYRMMRAHRVVWAMHHGFWPELDIDHINHDRSDNRIANMREVSRRRNCKNQSLSKANTSGHTGVSWCKRTQRWLAQVHPNRQAVFLGRYARLEDAVAARKAADVKYGFHDNHGG